VVGGRRYSFEDAVIRRLKELEGTLEGHREVLASETQRWLEEIDRAAIERLEALEASAADKTAEIQWVAAEQREGLEQAAGARFAELVEAAGRFATGPINNATDQLIEDLRHAARAQMDLLDELRSLDEAASQLESARARTTHALRRSTEALVRDVGAALEQPGSVDWSTAATTEARVEDELTPPPIHWSVAPDNPLWD
jgi:hypothetical protein